MAFFTDRERAALGKSLDVKVQGKVRELVRQEFGPRRRRPAEPNSPEDAGPMMRRRPAEPDSPEDAGPMMRRRPAEPTFTDDVGSMMRRATESSLQQIDDIIAILQRRRDKLLSETARVQREVIEYAKLSQSTVQSTKIIAESLEHLNKIRDPRPSEPEDDVSSGEEPAEAAAAPIDDAMAPVDDGAETDTPAAPEGATPETT